MKSKLHKPLSNLWPVKGQKNRKFHPHFAYLSIVNVILRVNGLSFVEDSPTFQILKVF